MLNSLTFDSSNIEYPSIFSSTSCESTSASWVSLIVKFLKGERKLNIRQI